MSWGDGIIAMGFYYLDGKKPVRAKTVDEMMEHAEDSRKVAITHINDTIHVSTVFLNLNLNFFDKAMGAPPLLFETMVFGESKWDSLMDRYCTWEEAEAGHLRIVEEIKKEMQS